MSEKNRMIETLNREAKRMEKFIPAILEWRRQQWRKMFLFKPGDTFPKNMGDTINITKKP